VSTPALPLLGGCACGAVRFQVDAPPVSASYCHCTRCQHRTGTAASAQARISPGSFSVVQGEELIGIWAPGGGWEKAFCSSCGAALFSRDPHDHGRLSVRLSAFDSDPGIRPQWHQFVAYAASWEPIPDDGLPRFPEDSP
jgi:hypothetical protein